MLTWHDAVAALTLGESPARIENRARVVTIEQQGEFYVASLFEADSPQASWTFGPEQLDNTKARITRFLGVYE